MQCPSSGRQRGWFAAANVNEPGVGVEVLGTGPLATFTDTTSASQAVDTGVVDINLGAPGTTNRLSTDTTTTFA